MKKSTENKIKAASGSWKRIVEELKSLPNYNDLKKDIFKIYEIIEVYTDFLEEEDWANQKSPL